MGLRGTGVKGFATGTIKIPDTVQASATGVASPGVPAGADIVAAYLYWETAEYSGSFSGQMGYFRGYPITGVALGNPNSPAVWSSGGCTGSSQGSKTLVAYRADVRPYLPLDSDGNFLAPNAATPGQYQVKLADSGSHGGGLPLTLGASLVIIYRVLSPATPLNSIILYDGADAPNNQSLNMSQTIVGFYQPDATHSAKLTHIVGNGTPYAGQQVFFNGNNPLPNLYSAHPGVAFPGVYNGTWDNPTWNVSGYVNGGALGFDTSASTSVVPNGGGCVDWGAIVFSTTVQDSDHDGLLDVWEDNQGYTDVNTGQWVALPGANKSVKDIFLEIDYLSNLDGSAGASLHSHLPRQAALDMVGDAYKNAPVDCNSVTGVCNGIKVHFDVGSAYQNDPYVIHAGTGGNAISEGALLCTDNGLPPLCAYPGTPAVGWKGGFQFVQYSASGPSNTNPSVSVPLGNFQLGRKDSYRYLLLGHATGNPRSSWSTAGTALSDPSILQLVSIVNSGTTATVTIQSPSGVLKPGDQVSKNDPAFGDGNLDRVVITGALGQTALNGTYHFSILNSSTAANGVTTTTFTVTTANVPNGTYNLTNEPQLAVVYGGPTSSSGHSDFGGGGDAAITFGLWGADDPVGCQADPSATLATGQVYCNNEVGTVVQQAGTLMHELGHSLTLTHGGTYYKDPQNPYLPTYEPNCKSNFLSVMNYMFQVRGFPDGGIDYSRQVFAGLDESHLNELTGIGLDSLGKPALHFTRWYAPPNSIDNQIQANGGKRYSTAHCDGTPIGPNEPPSVRVDGKTFSGPIDWNNNLTVPDAIEPLAWQDVDFNGSTASAPDNPAFYDGFHDWQALDLRQIGARAGGDAFSAGGGIQRSGGGIQRSGGGIQQSGGGIQRSGGGIQRSGGGIQRSGRRHPTFGWRSRGRAGRGYGQLDCRSSDLTAVFRLCGLARI